MNNRRSSGNIVLVGLLVLVVVFYLIWCARVFWMLPRIGLSPGIPNQAMKEISAWHEAKRYFGPEPFRWNRYFEILKSPRQGVPKFVSVRRVTDRLLIATHPAKLGFAARFFRASDDWTSIDVATGPAFERGQPELSDTEKKKLLMSLPDVLSTD